MANLSASGPFNIEGVFVVPWSVGASVDDIVFIGAGSPPVVSEIDEEEFSIVGRAESITQSSGVMKLERGTVQGVLITRFGVTYTQWRTRLLNLVKNQENFPKIALISGNRYYTRVALGSVEDSFVVRGDGSFDVSFPFRELR